MADVFLSYASEDRERVQPLVRALESLDYSVWWDRNIDPGANFEEVIDAQLSAAKIVVAVWSPGSARSSWVHSEAMEGLERGVLVPVTLEAARLPLAFRHINTADLTGWNGQLDGAEFNRFTRSLSRVMAGEDIAAEPVRSQSSSHGPAKAWRWTMGIVLAALLVITTAWLRWGPTIVEEPVAAPANSIAVLDFNNAGSVDTGYIATGISDQIRDLLTRTQALRVASRTLSAGALETGSNRPRYFLEGAARTDAETLQVNVHLVDSENGFRIWSQSFNVRRAQVLDAAVDIVQAVIKQMNLPARNALTPDALVPTLNPAAFDAYLQGANLLKLPRTDATLQQAEEAFNAALRLDPGFATPYAGLCRVQLNRYNHSSEQRWFRSARDNCERALSLDANQAVAYSALGSLYITSGNYHAATKAYTAALNLSPADPEIAIGLGDSFLNTGDHERAEQWYRRAIAVDPQFDRSYQALGAFFFRLGAYDKAITAYRELVNVHPDYAPGWADLSAAFQLNGDLQEAVDAAQRSMELARTAQALSNGASALFFAGRLIDARDLYRQAIELTPENHILWGNLGEVELLLQDANAVTTFERAIQLARSNLQVNPTDAPTLGRLATYLATLPDRRDEAEAILARALEQRGEDPYLYYDAALTHLRLGNTSNATRDLNRALSLGYPKILADADPQLTPLTGLPTPAS